MSIASRISSRITEAMTAAPEKAAELEAADQHAVNTISAAHIEAKKALTVYLDQRILEVLARSKGTSRVRWLYHLVRVADTGRSLRAGVAGGRGLRALLVPAGGGRERAHLLRAGRVAAGSAHRSGAADAEIEIAETPRGPMPHVYGPIPRSAVVEVLALDGIATAPDVKP